MSDNVPLLRLYEFMRSISGEERLELARWITAKPELFNEWSRRSLRFFARYSNSWLWIIPGSVAVPLGRSKGP